MGLGPIPPWFGPMDPRLDILPQLSKFSPKNHIFFNRLGSKPVPYMIMVLVTESSDPVSPSLQWFRFRVHHGPKPEPTLLQP